MIENPDSLILEKPPLPGSTASRSSDGGPSTSDAKRFQRRYSPRRSLIVTIGGIALAETIAMIAVYFFRSRPYYQQVVLDASLMTVIIFPLLYFLSTRPLLQHIQQRVQTESILQTRLRLIQFAITHTLDELLQTTLDEVEVLTGSTIGYFHFLEAEQRMFILKAWSTNTVQNMCTAANSNGHYPVDQAGVWADCVRLRRPVIHNDYPALLHRKGLPEGHAPILREIAVPILRGDKIVAILGMGNKPRDYTPRDIELVSTLADFAWDIVEHQQAEDALRKSEEKFLFAGKKF